MADVTATPEEARFRIDSDVEIAYILRGLMKSNALVTAYFNKGRDFAVTAVLKVDPERRIAILDGASGSELNERLLRSRDVKVESTQDGVKVQFSVPTVEGVSFDGRLAFRIPFPDSLVKMQRRQYYRVQTPLLRPIKCDAPLADGARVELPISDIGLGGLCLVGQPADESWEIGRVLEGCRIVLPEEGTLQVSLFIRNSYHVRLKSEMSVRHTGCEFVRLGAKQEAMVQRYIIKLERERRAKRVDTR